MERDLTAAEFQRFHDEIYRRSGIHYPTEKLTLLSNRIRRRLRAKGMHDYDGYLAHVQRGNDKAELQAFLDTVTTNETYFFRCPRHWDFFRNWAQERARSPEIKHTGLRLWSAAASNGAEAYTMLIVLHEVLGTDFGGCRIEVLGTDLNASILEEARAATFRPYAVAQMPPELVRRYFTKVGEEQFRFDAKLARLVTFQRHNLMEPMPGRTFDFVFLRNVMIYFDTPSKERVLEHMHTVLRPGGFLMVGESESLMGVKHGFTYTKPSIFQKPVAVKTPT